MEKWTSPPSAWKREVRDRHRGGDAYGPLGEASAGRGPRSSWLPPGSPPARAALAVALNVVPAALGVVLLATVAPASDWSDPLLVAMLVLLSGLAYAAEQRLGVNRVFFGATLAIATVALAVAGPIPALVVWVMPDLIARFTGRAQGQVAPALVANFSSYALGVVAGGLVLELAGAPTGGAMAPALFSAGVAMAVINFGFARLTFAPFYQGASVAALMRDEFKSVTAAVLAMILLGDLVAVLIEPTGGWAVLILPATLFLPRLAVEQIARTSSVTKLERSQAMQVYVAALADVLELPRDERDQLACAADLIEPIAGNTDGIKSSDWATADVPGAAMLALHAGERWSGNGWPAGLPADAIPYGSRILAVAQEWTDLTAKGTPELSQEEAMLALSAQTETEFDPAIVAAAMRVVNDEAGFSRDPKFLPKLHRMWLPRTVRRGALPTLLPRLVDATPG